MTKPLELGVTVAAIVLSVFLKFLIHKYVYTQPPAQVAAITKPKPPTPANIEWAAGSRTLILALQTSCHFCDESAPFYKRLIASADGQNIRLIAVMPFDVEASTEHLKKLGLTGLEVKSATLGSIQVNGTPTLLLVNEKGEVTDQWIGKLSADREAEVMQKMSS